MTSTLQNWSLKYSRDPYLWSFQVINNSWNQGCWDMQVDNYQVLVWSLLVNSGSSLVLIAYAATDLYLCMWTILNVSEWVLCTSISKETTSNVRGVCGQSEIIEDQRKVWAQDFVTFLVDQRIFRWEKTGKSRHFPKQTTTVDILI